MPGATLLGCHKLKHGCYKLHVYINWCLSLLASRFKACAGFSEGREKSQLWPQWKCPGINNSDTVIKVKVLSNIFYCIESNSSFGNKGINCANFLRLSPKFSTAKETWWPFPLWQCGYRHDICPKFYTAGISGQKFYTTKVRILDIVQSRLKSANALNISNLGIFFNSFSDKNTRKVIEPKISVLIMPGNSCLTEKFTPLAKNLHCHRQWRHGQIPPLL